ncbi:hypothetical protein DH2020_031448 [Rehmannia glutinosa]|uniref:Acyl-[acyl-carrier-protein] desaturase n=1 Tax=Rehmannia glutinosa TaxID=99300 RepID=A0ABR0VJJ4_REHGL
MASTSLAFFNITTTYRRQQPISGIAKLPPPTLRHHSMPPEKVEVFKSLEPWVSKHVLPLLKPVDKCWQPSDFLPDSTKPVNDFMDEVRALQDRTIGLPDEYFVVLVGDMITEEALPTYQTVLNTLDGVRDQTGASPSPWATWIRAWTAEENRHGDLLKTYLYLSGRVDMLMIERTVQYLIGAGCDIGVENNPYLGFVYTSFQERATFVSHGNTARLAKEGGDPILARMCANIAADEKRHENAYVRIVEKLLEIDPNETMLAIGNMMRKKIVMPAHLMYDGRNPNIFEHFSYVANRLRVYTASDYADILEFLVGRWRLEKIEGLKSDGRCEQEFVCGLGARIRKLQEREDERADKRFHRRFVKLKLNIDDTATKKNSDCKRKGSFGDVRESNTQPAADGYGGVFGLNEASLLSKTALTDLIFPERGKTNCVTENLPQQMEKESSSNSKMTVKAMVQKSRNKVLFAEAGDDFIKFLSSFLIIPLGGVEYILGNNTCLKNIDNLYRSIVNINGDKYLKTKDMKFLLLRPENISRNQILPLTDQKGLSPVIFPKGEGNYVKGQRMYLVTDDLIVTPFSMTSSFSILSSLKHILI